MNIGTRQQGRDRGKNVVDVPYERDAIRAAIENNLTDKHIESDHLYGDGRSGERIAELLAKIPYGIEKRLDY